MKRLAINGFLILALFLPGCGGSGGSSSSGAAADLAAACPGGVCGREETANCGGSNSATCSEGFTCADIENDACDPSSTADCPGTCVRQVSVPPVPACGTLNGVVCGDGEHCVDDPNDDCEGGPAVDCPGICEPRRDSAGCSTDAECPVLRVECTVCADGSLSCPRSHCEAGQCAVEMRGCSDLINCGGFAGFECPPGLLCADAKDDCDPANGGADCPGVCIAPAQPACGGADGKTCSEGEECVQDPNDGCDAATGVNCSLVCQPRMDPECSSDAECPQIRAACSICSDGSAACPTSTCADGHCTVAYPTCPRPLGCDDANGGCKPGYVCADDPADGCDPQTNEAICNRTCVPEDAGRRCGGSAGETCPPGFACVEDASSVCDPATGAGCGGVCAPAEPPPCSSDAECPAVVAACTQCSDASFACPHSACTNGQCSVTIEACPLPKFCGGFAGFQCADGFVCIDDPSDDCDAARGGADCGGLCVMGDSSGCASDADCAAIGAPCRVCPDGSTACPRSYCVNGSCQAEFPGCDASTPS